MDHIRYGHGHVLAQQQQQYGRPVSSIDAAHASEYFEHFINATSLKTILGYHRSICDHLHLKPNLFPLFYPKLRANLTTWKAKALLKKFDARAAHKCYGKGKICANTRVLIIGAGPCGLRTAIEAQLLGAKVVVVEKRDRLSRNNVLHLWPFVIEDLRALGAKKFFGKFCAGAIDHISIRQLQCILLKVALLLGVEIHTEVSFEKLIEPSATEKTGWRAEFKPADHPVAQYEFDVIIGADGKRNTLQGFNRKEFRGKLAIAITANFINKKTEAEARVEEISGVAFIFNQKFFKDLYEETKIDLENIVYYKDDTHYFVMTAKKASLLEKGVIKQDLSDTEKLLAMENVDRDALQEYAKEAANFSTDYQMPDLEFAVNHYGQPDVAMFDFTSMYAAENASKTMERNGHQLLMILVGDSLLEPFWPTGSGCARGFLSSLDAAWAIRSWASPTTTPLDVLAERESIYRLLAQTTPDNLNKEWKSYTLDPITRYPNLNKNVVMPHQVISLYDTDNPDSIEQMRRAVREVTPVVEVPRKRRHGDVDNDVLFNWIAEQVKGHEDITLTDLESVLKDGKVLCAIIHHYRPDLLDYNAIKDDNPAKNNQLAFDLLEKELGIPPIVTGEEITNSVDYLTMVSYLTQVYHTFRGEIPHIKHQKLELPETKRSDATFKMGKLADYQQASQRQSARHKRHAEPFSTKANVDRKTRKRRTLERVGTSVVERQKALEEIAANRNERQNKRRQQRRLQTEQFLKSMQMLQMNAKPDNSEPFEDYSIFLYRQTAPNFEDRVKDLEKKFTYVPDHDNKLPSLNKGGNDEDLQARIKNLENKWKDPQPVERKPKDLLRAIGKLDTNDWNVKEIEKKIMENKLGKPSNKDKEKVPKWSKEQFLARQTKMENKHLDRQDSTEAKFADIDKNIKHLDMKLKEGTVRELGQNKVASITEKLVSKVPTPTEQKPVEKNTSRPQFTLPTQAASEFCHFCDKRVYLMERLSAEGRFFHHGCFKCQYCHTQLRLGSYSFDRDGQYGHKFFCVHHYGMQGELPRPTRVVRKPSQKHTTNRSPDKKRSAGVAGLDLLDRVQTPERIEFANLSSGSVLSDNDEPLTQMDEDEWTDKNFGASCAELDDTDESSSYSDSDSDDDEEAYDDALEEPATKEGTLRLAQKLKYYRKKNLSESDEYSSSDQSSYDENSSDDEDSDTATEGEEEIRARELRKQEVRVEPPLVHPDTGTDTEVKINSTSIPDILSNHSHLNANVPTDLNRSSDNISVNSADFNSAESGDLDFNMNHKSNENLNDAKEQDSPNVVQGKLTIPKPPQPKINSLTKSATASNITNQKVVRNFVIPKKEKRNSFGNEFIPKFKSAEPEPLLIIKRTPSKITLPKEHKPKVAVNTTPLNVNKKYFGDPQKNTPKLKRSETVASVPKAPIKKQQSLPETKEESEKVISFNFEPEDTDIDDYIENLLANEEELQKPIDSNKFKIDYKQESEEENISSSIEDLFKALDKETNIDEPELSSAKPENKIEDLLQWMEELDHQTEERKVYRSFSDVKYKNLEKVLKAPSRGSSIVSKIPKNNLTYFERHLSGKGVPTEESDDENKGFSLKRSKTDVHCNKPRTSVDLDAVKKVDIKKMLQKFESMDEPDDKKPIPVQTKRRSFGNFRSTSINTNNQFSQNKPSIKTSSDHKSNNGFKDSLDDAIKDMEKYVHDNFSTSSELKEAKGSASQVVEAKPTNDWCANITVTSIPSMEYLEMTNQANNVQNNESNENLEKVIINEEKEELPKDVVDLNINSPVEHVKPGEDSSDVSDILKPIDFSKAVQSSTSDVSEIKPIDFSNVVQGSSSEYSDTTESTSDEDSSNDSYSEESKIPSESPQDFAKAVEGSSADVSLVSDHSKQNISNKTEVKQDECELKNNDNAKQEVVNIPNIELTKTVEEDSNEKSSKEPKLSSDNVEQKCETQESEKQIENIVAELNNITNENQKSNITRENCAKSKFFQPNEVITEEPIYSEIQDLRQAGSNTPKQRANIVGVVGAPATNLTINLEDLYAKVNKSAKSCPNSPPVPKRTKKKSLSENDPPELPERSNKYKTNENKPDCNLPIPPQRKRCSTVSPLPRRKFTSNSDSKNDIASKQLSPNTKSSSTSNLNIKKEVVSSYNLPKPQTVEIKGSANAGTSFKSSDKHNKDKDKDCCIQ